MTRKATEADKDAVRRLLGHDPEPRARLDRMIRDVINEAEKHGLQAKVDLRKTDGDDDPWISEADLELQLAKMAADLKAQGIQPHAAILHPSALSRGGRKIEGMYIDEHGREQRFEGLRVPGKVRSGGMTMLSTPGGWAVAEEQSEFDQRVRAMVDKGLLGIGRPIGPDTP